MMITADARGPGDLRTETSEGRSVRSGDGFPTVGANEGAWSTTQVLDQRTRCMLHDEVLPLIHTVMLSLSAG